MPLVRRKVANPGPSVMAIVNPKKGRKTMPAKKKSTASKSGGKARAKKATPKRPRKNPATKGRKPGRKPRRNPISGGVIGEAIQLAGSGIVLGFVRPLIQPLVQRFVGSSPLANAGVTGLTGYGLKFLAGWIPFTRRYQRPIELATWTIVATQLASAYVVPLISNVSVAAGAGMSGPWPRRRGMRGIAAVSDVPPRIMRLPAPTAAPTSANGGMKGMAAVNGRRRFR